MLFAVARCMPGMGVPGVYQFENPVQVRNPEIVCVHYFILIHYSFITLSFFFPNKGNDQVGLG